MIVYANQIQLQGIHVESVLFTVITDWMEKQLGFHLSDQQLRTNDRHKGNDEGKPKAMLKTYSYSQDDTFLCAYVLQHEDETVQGRRWIVQIGIRKSNEKVDLSCVLMVNDINAWIPDPVNASRPGIIDYIRREIKSTKKDFTIARDTPGQRLESTGSSSADYRAFLHVIHRKERKSTIVIVSPTNEGKYLVEPTMLQSTLFGLADVYKVPPNSNTHIMKLILKQFATRDGTVTVISPPTSKGESLTKLFRSDAIMQWGENQERISKILAWVTTHTNISRLQEHVVSPVMIGFLSMQQRNKTLLLDADKKHESELRREKEDMIKEQNDLFQDLVQEKDNLDKQLEEKNRELWTKGDKIDHLEFKLSEFKDSYRDTEEFALLWKLAHDIKHKPTPMECLEIVEEFYGDRCTVLDSAKKSAKEMMKFEKGRDLLEMIRKLVDPYRNILLEGGGDIKAKNVFGKQFAAMESETLMKNKKLRDMRTFDYRGNKIFMPRHLKIGIDHNIRKTLRLHFHWDNESKNIVIGYCGKHLPLPSN